MVDLSEFRTFLDLPSPALFLLSQQFSRPLLHLLLQPPVSVLLVFLMDPEEDPLEEDEVELVWDLQSLRLRLLLFPLPLLRAFPANHSIPST
jgi:hypothetical protein